MKLVLAILLSCLLCGCGYHLTGQGGSLSGQYSRLFIPNVSNQTSEPYLDSILTTQLSREIARQNNHTEVFSNDSADAKLLVRIRDFQNRAVSYDNNDDIAEYQVSITVDAELFERTGQPVGKPQTIKWQSVYSTSDDKMSQSDAEQAAVREVCQRLATEIFFQADSLIQTLP